MSTGPDPATNSDDLQRDTRRVVKTRFEPDVFERINKIRQDRGVEWSTVVLCGIAEIEQEIPPYQERYNVPPSESADDE